MKRGLVVLAGVITMLGSSVTPAASAASKWVLDGNATWVKGAGDDGGANYGIVTVSAGDGTYNCSYEGQDCYGQALLNANVLPTSNPAKINALSYDFNPAQASPAQGGYSGGSPRIVMCFSDSAVAANCDSNGELGPLEWATPGKWTHSNAFAAPNNAANVWINQGGSCPNADEPSWKAIVACHPGVKIIQIRLVNDSGWLFPAGSGETIKFDNLRVNGLITNAP
jgi:hypothetical protein